MTLKDWKREYNRKDFIQYHRGSDFVIIKSDKILKKWEVSTEKRVGNYIRDDDYVSYFESKSAALKFAKSYMRRPLLR